MIGTFKPQPESAKGCVLGSCGCALAMLVGCPVVFGGLGDEGLRQVTLGFVLLALTVALFMSGSRPPPLDSGVWKCESCGEPNSESLAGCEACGKHRT